MQFIFVHCIDVSLALSVYFHTQTYSYITGKIYPKKNYTHQMLNLQITSDFTLITVY